VTRAVIAAMSDELRRTLDPLVPAGAPCALVDFPAYANVGDHAVWTGERAYLRNRGAPVAYVCSERSYRRDALAASAGTGPILLSGGGNFGDLYPRHQRLRERVIADFPGNPVVQLPQSVEFRDPDAVARARAVIEAHGNVTLLVRERSSLAKVRALFPGTPHALCPDMSIACTDLPRRGSPAVPLLALRRRDAEARRDEPLPGHVPSTDWAGSPLGAGVSRLAGHVGGGRTADAALGAVSRSFVRHGVRVLSRGETVVTDRLHAHILALMLGIPHVVCDNSYGKLRSFVETWTSGCDIVTWAESWPDAVAHSP
jgi:pyruvyl transferase EpsO